MRVFGSTATGGTHGWTFKEFMSLPGITVVADLHCARGITSTGHEWFGVPSAAVLATFPPAPDVTHVAVWAEYGYNANLRLADFTSDRTVLATHHNGESLTAEHGFPVRLVVPHLYGWKGPKWVRSIEYLTHDRRGFWEERGHHNVAEVAHGQRYAHQEHPGDGPPLGHPVRP